MESRKASKSEVYESSRARPLIEGWYPAPIAQTFARAAADRGDDPGTPPVVELAGSLLRYIGLVATRDLLSRPADWSGRTATVLESFRRPISDGKWLEILRHTLETGTPFDPELAALFQKGQLDSRLNEIVRLRNKVVHENRTDLVDDLKRAVGAVLTEMTGLRFHRIVVPTSLESRDSGIYRYRATLYRGFATPPPTVRIRTDAELEVGRAYLSRAGQSQVLPLFPCFIEEGDKGSAPELHLLSQVERGKARSVAVSGRSVSERTARDASLAFEKLRDKLDRSPGALTPRRFEISGDVLVSRRRLGSGDRIGDRFTIREFIGSGGMADVYEATDENGAPVALKMLPLELTRSEESLRRFMSEIRQARSVEHPHVVRYLDHGEDRGDHFLVLERADGWAAGDVRARDLGTYLDSLPDPSLDANEAIAIAIDIASGLHAVHEQGIVHRDLKPGNVMLFEEGGRRRAKVGDFGVSRQEGDETITLTGFTVGSPEYISPEQASGRRRGTEPLRESDIYSLGCVLYRLLAGSAPLRGKTPLETALLHGTKTPEPLASRVPGIPAELSAIVMKCLAKEPTERFRTAGELHAALRSLDPAPPRAIEDAAEAEGRKPKRRPRSSDAPTIAGFEVVEEVGAGAQGSVYRARDLPRLGVNPEFMC